MYKWLSVLFKTVHGLIAGLFAAFALALIVIAGRLGWKTLSSDLDEAAAQVIIEAIGLLAAAVVGLQIAEIITEEEVLRDADISAPTRVRRFLSRFFVVVLVALAVEGLVATFRALHEDPSQLIYASSVIASTALLLIAWGVFIALNRKAEELEPDAMEDAKQEDAKVANGGE